MIQGMLELTGQREDQGGYYRKKFEMAKKAWEVRLCVRAFWSLRLRVLVCCPGPL